ncbi:ciliogenesis-associated TTC17-interacting protein [Capsella rubella]|uniref:ciliogenesis-associated TTC17-interacting protein n=1 Tax=Capsella rubella TaxID=81985 RepID=UPI000CD4B044|nr:ciliogenesis-associated TTC17-interacting protein [Capsella rubella]
MGCFMGCFGLSSNKKRRNSIRKILPRDQRICSYEPLLHSSDPSDFTTFVDSNLRGEAEEENKKVTKKTRKRVRFDLNVQTYEPIVPPRFENDCSDSEEGNGERSKGSSVTDKKPEDLSSTSVYPSNYRYHNCVTSFEDEDDEVGYGESDLEDEDYYTDDENDYEDDADDEDEEEEEEDKDQDVTPLLNPVENLAQWKAVKARPVKHKREMKENLEADMDDQAKPLLKEIIVNTSLSNWIASPKSFHGNGSLKRSPIVDITNMENR